MLKSLATVVAVMALALPAIVKAAPLDFSFQAATDASSNFDFKLDSAPKPDSFDGIEAIFELKGIENSSPQSYEVRFFNSDVSGGLSVDYPANQNLNFNGQQIYGGSESNPTLHGWSVPIVLCPRLQRT